MFFSVVNFLRVRAFRATIPDLKQADQRLLDVMSTVVQTGGIVQAFENADELLEAPLGRDMLGAAVNLWDAVKSTEAAMHGLLLIVKVGVRSGNRLGAEHQMTAGHLRRALGAEAYSRLELPVMTLYAGNQDKPQKWWVWLLGHYYAAAGGQPPTQ